jgi:hypothetical protein
MICQIVIRSYTFCATVTQILQFRSGFHGYGPPPSPGSLLAILCQSCSLLSSHTFSYTFLYVPGRPITSWSDSRSAHSSAHLTPHRFPANQLSPVPKLLSIKFPYVLLYVLIRSGPPHHFLELWDSRSAHASAHLSPHHSPANQLSHSSACTEVGFKSLKMNILRHPRSCC